jgi:hypothetical protein
MYSADRYCLPYRETERYCFISSLETLFHSLAGQAIRIRWEFHAYDPHSALNPAQFLPDFGLKPPLHPDASQIRSTDLLQTLKNQHAALSISTKITTAPLMRAHLRDGFLRDLVAPEAGVQFSPEPHSPGTRHRRGVLCPRYLSALLTSAEKRASQVFRGISECSRPGRY